MLPSRSTAMLWAAVNSPAWRPTRPKAAERLVAGAIDDAHLAVRSIHHVDELLLPVGREGDLVDRAVEPGIALEEMLGHEGAVLAEDLIAVIDAVADIDQAVLGDAHAVHRIAELLRDRLGGIIGRRLLVARPVAVGAP